MYHLFDFEFNDLDNSYEENVTNNNNFEYNKGREGRGG